MNNDFKTLWKGEYVSVVSPKDHPYEVLHEINGIMVIPIVGNKIGIRKELVPPYLIKDTSGKNFYFTVIAGGVEEGETPEEAVVRELKEEAGIVFKNPEVTEIFREMPMIKSSDMRMTFFIYEDDQYTIEEPEGDGTEYEDVAKTIWITLDQFKEVIEQDNIDYLLYSAYYFLTVYLRKKEIAMKGSKTITITHLGNSFYQVDDNATPVDKNTLKGVLESSLALDDTEINTWIEDLEKTSVKEISPKVGETGVIVDLYEVDYPVTDPMKATEDLASHLDEKKDFVTQYLFPGSVTEEVIVGLRQDILEEDKNKETPPLTSRTFFKIMNQKNVSDKEKAYIIKTSQLPQGLLENTFGATANNWIHLKFKKEGKIIDSLIGGDTFRYIIAVQEGPDIEHFSINYTDLVKQGINPLDFVHIINETCKVMPVKVDEDTILSDLIAEGNLDVQDVFAVTTKKYSWKKLREVNYDTSKEYGWGWPKENKVQYNDVFKFGDAYYYQFLSPISSSQLQVDTIYGVSYNQVNSGYELIKFKGFSYSPNASGPEVSSVAELKQKFGVRSLKELYYIHLYNHWRRVSVYRNLDDANKEKVDSFFQKYPNLLTTRSIPDFYMWGDYSRDNGEWAVDKGYYYLYEGRWARGSGAEKLTFWLVEEVTPSDTEEGND